MRSTVKRLAAVWLFPATLALTDAVFGAAAAEPINQIGVDLLRRLSASSAQKNLVFSPYSIGSAFALAYAGADGITRQEIRQALHFPQDDATLRDALSAVNDALDAMVAKSRSPSESADVEWHLANRLFGQKDYRFQPAFLTLLRDGYHAPFVPLDFRAAPEKSRATINRWVEEQTKQRIKAIIPTGGVSADTRLVLVNAVYLKAPWMFRFEEENTAPRSFRFSTSRSAPVPTMQRIVSAGFAKHDGFTTITLPYLAGELQFLILLPDEVDATDPLAMKVTPEILQECARLPETKINLFLPKFRIEGASLALGKNLQAMGLMSAFDLPPGSANFDRAAPRKPGDYLAISQVFHQAFIAVDEQGTEASAATVVELMTLGVAAKPPPPPTEVHIDRPFLFAIQHRASGTCLFLGRVSDPR